MKSFRRIYLIVTVLVVLFLLIGLPNNTANNSSDTTRTITVFPSVSTDPRFSNPDQSYVTTLQASTVSYYAEGDQLNIGTQSGAWGLTGVDDDSYQQFSSQYIITETASGKSITTGSEGTNTYTATQAYDGTYDSSLSTLNSSEYTVSDETFIVGTNTVGDYTDTQTKNDVFETISEGGAATGGSAKPSSYGPDCSLGIRTTYPVSNLWDDEGNVVRVLKIQTLHTNSCDTTGISGTIESVTLYANYSVQDASYSGTQSLEFHNGTGPYQTTTITPTNADVNPTVKSETIYSGAGSVTLAELQTLNLKFYNNDGAGPTYVAFDRIWLEVTVSPADFTLEVWHDFAGVPDSAGFYELCIYGNRSIGELINIDVYNYESGDWDTLGQITSTTSAGWHNFTTVSEDHVLDSYLTLRYKDSVPDSTQSDLTVDVALIKVSGYTLDLKYSFQWAGGEANLDNVSVWDVGSGTQDLSAYVYDWDGTQWVHLFDLDSSTTDHSNVLSSNPGRFIHANGTIKVRYLEVNSDSSSTLDVDYLCVNLHFSADVGGSGTWQINMVYDIQDFPFDRSTVDQITVLDSSFVDSGSAEAQIYDYTSNQWVSCFTIGTGVGDSPHSETLSSSPSRFISSNPGNVQIRYVLSDATGSTLSVDFLRVDITYGGDGGGDVPSDGGGGGGGGDGGGTTIIRTLSAQITYSEEVEKFVEAEIDVILTDDEGTFVNNASVTLTFGNDTEPIELEEKEDYYTLLIETDTLETGNYTFTISAEKSGFRNFLSSAFPFNIVVKYPFATAVQHPEYWSEVRENPVSLLLDPSAYVLPLIITTLITLQVTTFASIDPRKLRSIYVFTNEGQGLYYRTFFEGKGDVDSQLMSAALSGIVSLVMEATRSDKPMRTIDIETFEIFLEYGQFVTIATFVGKRIFYKRKIRRGQRKLIENIERKYSQVLTQWDGDLSHFYELNQLVFEAFEFKLTKDLAKLIAGAAKVQLELVSLYSAQEKFHMSGRALWKAYDLYAQIKDRRAQFILERWKALEKAYLADYVGSTSVLKTRLLSQFFKLLDFIRTAGLLKILYKIRGIIYPEISKELYYFIPPEQLTERTDEGL